MCFNSDVSLAAFLMGVLGGILCYKTGIVDYKIIGLFLIFISLIQGIEYLLWNHQTCDDYNKFLSKTAMIINHLQPVILAILVITFNKNVNLPVVLIPLVIYALCIIPYSLNNSDCTIKNKSEKLGWQWTGKQDYFLVYSLFLACFVIFALCLPTPKYATMFSLFIMISYTFSYFIYRNTQSVGTMWCFFSAFSSYLFLFLK